MKDLPEMRIAILVYKFPSWTESMILTQITQLVDRGHEVDIYTGHPESPSHAHAEVLDYRLLDRTYYLPYPPNRLMHRPKTYWILLQAMGLGRHLGISKPGYAAIKMLKKSTYDIIHCQFGTIGLRSLVLRDIGLLRGKLVTSFRGYDATKYPANAKNGVYDPLFRRGDLFLAVSQHIKNRLIELGCDERKVLVHRSAIDCSKFHFSTRKLEQPDEIRLVTIARLVEKKGLEYSICAVAELASSRKNIRYQIVGDGALRKDLQRLIQELGVGNVVTLLGWKSHQEAIEILDHSHIYISPSVTARTGDQEGIPNGLKEAMAMGLPVVGTKHAGIPELVTDGVSGFLVPERDVHSLAERITYLIENTEIWPKIGRAARAVVENRYDVNKLSDELVGIYQGLLLQ